MADIVVLLGYLFWTGVSRVHQMNLATNKKVTLPFKGVPHVISLSYTSRWLFWVDAVDGIVSCSYDGRNKTTVRGSFNYRLLGIFNNSLYSQKAGDPYIKEMDRTSETLSRHINVGRTRYRDLFVFHASLQPLGTGECLQPCGAFGYCNKINKSCDCEFGYEMKEKTCTDIDECLSLPCGPKPKINCTNIPGSYQCSVCDEGLLLYQNSAGEGRCLGPTPYLLISTRYDIHAVHLSTKEKDIVARLQDSSAMTIDTVEMKLYFEDNNGIRMREINRVDVKVIIKNGNVEKMAIDWIGRRIFWTEGSSNRISVANLDGKARKVLSYTTGSPRGIAIDPISGFLFWTEIGAVVRFNLADRIKLTLVPDAGNAYAVNLDRSKERVYWFELFSNIRHLKSCDYGGKDVKTIASGSFNEYLLGVLGDSLYFLNTIEYRINDMNVSNGNISRTFQVDRRSYYDLLVVDKPTFKEESFHVSCGSFGYFNRVNNSCACVVGFVKNETNCTDIDECLSLPCGPKAENNCTNIPGSYECSACDEGLLLFQKRCIAYSDLKIRLVNPANNNTGRIEIYHPSFGWGTVCGGWGWDDTASGVVCRQLGFAGANATRKNSYYGEGSGPTLLYDPQCTGDESYVWDCSHHGWNALTCPHNFDVGVDCY